MLRRQTDSWEPMLAWATGVVVVAVLGTTIARDITCESPLMRNVAIVGILLFGIGLIGLIGRTSTARMFLAAGVMLAGAAVMAFGCGGPLGGLLDGAKLIAAVAVGGMWIAAAVFLIRLANDSREHLHKLDTRMNTQLYALLTAVGFVVLVGVLRMGG